ncbi:MAG: hypothetical protein ISQ03_03935 [Pseudomonadales bacterium]|nr:hypothetical protein [Pseudomonadales bacterium]
MSADPFIEAAEIAPGHDGAAELVLFVRYPGAGRQTLTLAAEEAEVLFEHTQAGDVHALCGVPWHILKTVLKQPPGAGTEGGRG